MPLDPKEFDNELENLPDEDMFDNRIYSISAKYDLKDWKDVNFKYAMDKHFEKILRMVGGRVEERKHYDDGVEVIITNPEDDDFSQIAPIKSRRELSYEDYRLEFNAPVGDGLILRWVDVELLA